MEQARVTIIGAGPAGLVMGLSLAKHRVKSVILEKEKEITQDPRGVYLAADAVRILYDLGLGPDMPVIGHEPDSVQFHRTSFAETPFHKLDQCNDHLQQAVSMGVLQIQPALEKALRDHVMKSGHCDLRVGCNVERLEEYKSGVHVNYTAQDGSAKHIHTEWLIGADGKRGVVRKTFLEPLADIRQVHSDYRYEGTWVAANLHILLPTPKTHPNLPAWELGMTPEEVYDLFWPKGWHFCSPPGKPTAAGRFGPHEQRLWRHEFRQDKWDDTTMDAEELFWEHLTPMITRTSTIDGRKFSSPTMFPKDCIGIMRCLPFTFTHKVVNRWFHSKSILIGDAAHVFPPFGGQGIASGIRDAHQLAWRIAIFESSPSASQSQIARVLSDWARERALSIKNAATVTRMNGTLCNNDNLLMFKAIQLVEWLRRILFGTAPFNPQTSAEKTGLINISGCFLNEYGGGVRLPQIYLNTLFGRRVLSDSIFDAKDSPLRLLVLVQSSEIPKVGLKTLQHLLTENKIPPSILSHESIVVVSLKPCHPESVGFLSPSVRKVSPTPINQLSRTQTKHGYNVAAFAQRLGSMTKYAIVRPDFFVFATAKDVPQLRLCLKGLSDVLN